MHTYVHTKTHTHTHIHPEPRVPKQRRPQDLKDPPTLLHESIKPSAFLRSINLLAFRSPCRSCSHFSGLKPHFTELFSFSSIRASKRNKTSSVSPSQARKSVKSFARPSCMEHHILPEHTHMHYYICIAIHYIHTYTDTHIHTYIHTCIHTHVHTYVYTHKDTYTHVHICRSVCIQIFECVCYCY